VYSALGGHLDTRTIGNLLQVLLDYTPLQSKPTITALRVIINGLSADVEETRFLVVHVLCSAHQWFVDSDLQPVLQEASVWERLGASLPRFTTEGWETSRIFFDYLALGNQLSQTQEWKPIIAQDLPSWLSILEMLPDMTLMTWTFCAVLSRVWNPDTAETESLGNEKPRAMEFVVLTDAWDGFDRVTNAKDISSTLALTRCSVPTAFCSRIGVQNISADIESRNPSQQFKDVVMLRLGAAVAVAAERVKKAATHDTHDLAQESIHTMVCAAEVLVRLASTINGELRDGPPDPGEALSEKDSRAMIIKFWTDLKQGFNDELDMLTEAFHRRSQGGAEVN
jgi:hypothetical protein